MTTPISTQVTALDLAVTNAQLTTANTGLLELASGKKDVQVMTEDATKPVATKSKSLKMIVLSNAAKSPFIAMANTAKKLGAFILKVWNSVVSYVDTLIYDFKAKREMKQFFNSFDDSLFTNTQSKSLRVARNLAKRADRATLLTSIRDNQTTRKINISNNQRIADLDIANQRSAERADLLKSMNKGVKLSSSRKYKPYDAGAPISVTLSPRRALLNSITNSNREQLSINYRAEKQVLKPLPAPVAKKTKPLPPIPVAPVVQAPVAPVVQAPVAPVVQAPVAPVAPASLSSYFNPLSYFGVKQ